MAATLGDYDIVPSSGDVTAKTATINVTAGDTICVFAGIVNSLRTFSIADADANDYGAVKETAYGTAGRIVYAWTAVAAETTTGLVITVTPDLTANVWVAAFAVPGGVYSESDAVIEATTQTSHHCANSPGLTIPAGALVLTASGTWSGSPGTITLPGGDWQDLYSEGFTSISPSIVQAREFTSGAADQQATFTSSTARQVGSIMMVFEDASPPVGAVFSYPRLARGRLRFNSGF